MCGYINEDTDDFDWARHRGFTASTNTGPSADHTKKTVLGIFLQIGM